MAFITRKKYDYIVNASYMHLIVKKQVMIKFKQRTQKLKFD